MTHKKKTYGHQLGPMTHFWQPQNLTYFIYGGEMWKKPLFLSLFLGKRGQIGKKFKKSWCGHQLRTMAYFSKYHTFDPLLYLGSQMLRTHFFYNFFGKNRSNNKIFGKKETYGHQLGPMTHFLTTTKFDLLLYIGEMCLQTHLQSFLCVP